LQVADAVSIEYVIREAIDECRINAESRKIEVTYNDKSASQVLGDRDQLIIRLKEPRFL